MRKVIVINPKSKKIETIDMPANAETLKFLYETIGCELVDKVGLDDKHDLILDDEGLFKEELYAFEIGEAKLVGKAVVMSLKETEDGPEWDGIQDENLLSRLIQDVKFIGRVVAQ
jgi:hypothetical protein